MDGNFVELADGLEEDAVGVVFSSRVCMDSKGGMMHVLLWKEIGQLPPQLFNPPLANVQLDDRGEIASTGYIDRELLQSYRTV